MGNQRLAWQGHLNLRRVFAGECVSYQHQNALIDSGIPFPLNSLSLLFFLSIFFPSSPTLSSCLFSFFLQPFLCFRFISRPTNLIVHNMIENIVVKTFSLSTCVHLYMHGFGKPTPAGEEVLGCESEEILKLAAKTTINRCRRQLKAS